RRGAEHPRPQGTTDGLRPPRVPGRGPAGEGVAAHVQRARRRAVRGRRRVGTGRADGTAGASSRPGDRDERGVLGRGDPRLRPGTPGHDARDVHGGADGGLGRPHPGAEAHGQAGATVRDLRGSRLPVPQGRRGLGPGDGHLHALTFRDETSERGGTHKRTAGRTAAHRLPRAARTSPRAHQASRRAAYAATVGVTTARPRATTRNSAFTPSSGRTLRAVNSRCALRRLRCCSSSSVPANRVVRTMSVATKPGHTALTPIPNTPSSARRLSLSIRTAALPVEYAGRTAFG